MHPTTHLLAHNFLFGAFCVALAAWLGRPRVGASVGAFLAFHLHLICDLAGSRGPDGDPWTIPYLWPFSDAWKLTWSGQWALNRWPNFVITAGLLAMMFFWAWKRGRTPLEAVNLRADRALVGALRRRFGEPT